MQIDEIDRDLLNLLKENARRPITDLARVLGLARSTVQSRLDRLESSGAITGYALKLGGPARARLHATALIAIEPRSGPAVLSRLKSLSQVERVHTTSGRWDLLAQLAANTPEELDETLDRIGETKGVRSSESLIHLSTKLDRAT